jgi:hypothetical protein
MRLVLSVSVTAVECCVEATVGFLSSSVACDIDIVKCIVVTALCFKPKGRAFETQ